MSAKTVSNGVYKISNRGAHWRVIRDGLTWSSQVSDSLRRIEFCDDGTYRVQRVAKDASGAVLVGSSEPGGTWFFLNEMLVLAPAPQERLVLTTESLATREPQYPRGRDDATLGLMIVDGDSWRGHVRLDERDVGLRFPAGPDDHAQFAHTTRTIHTLRGGALARARLSLAKDVYPEYYDYARALGNRPIESYQALAPAMRLDSLVIDAEGRGILWFGSVLGEHSILGLLSRDCDRVTLSQP